MEAQATVRFSTGSIELFGLENFGGAFNVPGLVTIGPNLRVLGVNSYLPAANASYVLTVYGVATERGVHRSYVCLMVQVRYHIVSMADSVTGKRIIILMSRRGTIPSVIPILTMM